MLLSKTTDFNNDSHHSLPTNLIVPFHQSSNKTKPALSFRFTSRTQEGKHQRNKVGHMTMNKGSFGKNNRVNYRSKAGRQLGQQSKQTSTKMKS